MFYGVVDALMTFGKDLGKAHDICETVTPTISFEVPYVQTFHHFLWLISQLHFNILLISKLLALLKKKKVSARTNKDKSSEKFVSLECFVPQIKKIACLVLCPLKMAQYAEELLSGHLIGKLR